MRLGRMTSSSLPLFFLKSRFAMHRFVTLHRDGIASSAALIGLLSMAVVILAGSVIGAADTAVPKPGNASVVGPDKETLQAARKKAADFLRTSQPDDGSWTA